MKLAMQSSLLIVILSLLVFNTFGYLQFKLSRNPSNIDIKKSLCKCSDESPEADYKQVCYQKDTAYSIELVNDKKKQINHMAMDFTIPFSWIKGANCMAKTTKDGTDSSSACKKLQSNLKQKLKNIKEEVQQQGQKIIEKVTKKKKHANQDAQGGKIFQISGSSEVVRGPALKQDGFTFTTIDQGKLGRVLDLFMMGFYLATDQDNLMLQNTTFIAANQISDSLNKMADGAISLRFDEGSENSFLTQIFNYVQSSTYVKEKFVGVYLGKQKYNNKDIVTIGEMSLRYAEGGYGSISWIKAQTNSDYGKTPKIDKIFISDTEDSQYLKEVQVKDLSAIFSLSASYVSIPDKILNQTLNLLSKVANCSIDQQTQFVECTAKHQDKFYQKQVGFNFDNTEISIDIKDLVVSKHKKKYILALKKSLKDEFAILGEPIFKKYFMLFDYKNDRIGKAPLRQSLDSGIINVLALVRFVTITFTLGCCFLVCFRPCTKVYQILTSPKGLRRGPEGKRLRQYSPIQQNPYEDLKGKIQDVINSEEGNEIN